jgi:hypothetical protein
MDNKTIIKYFNIVLLSEKDDNFFDVYDILVPRYLKIDTTEKRAYFTDLKSEIIEFGKAEGYFNQFGNGSCELTKKGKLAKQKGGHLKYQKSQKKYWFTKYQMIYFPFFILFGFFAIYQTCSENNQKSDSLNIEHKPSDSLSNSETIKFEKTESEKETENKEKKILSKKKPDCDIATLVKINSLIDKNVELSDQNFDVFFANMNPDCPNNAEYSELNNELIFKTLKSNPKKFIAFLNRVSKKKEILEFVLIQLRNPINDGIELKVINERLGKTPTEDAKTKELVYASIKKAIEKNK